MLDLNEEWEQFLENPNDEYFNKSKDISNLNTPSSTINSKESENEMFNSEEKIKLPKSTDIYISTKTKISYLNIPIPLHEDFLEIAYY